MTSSFETSSSGGLSRRDFLKLGGAGFAGAALLATPGIAAAQSSSYIDYQEHGPAQFSEGNKSGTTVNNGGLRLSNSSSSGWMTSRPVGTPFAFDTLIPSWDGNIPAGTSIVMMVRVRYGGRWSDWMSMGTYSAVERSRSASTSNPNWRINIDTIESRNGERAGAYQYHFRLVSDSEGRSPIIRSACLVASQSGRHGEKINAGNLKRAWGKSLYLPLRSQYDYDQGAAWCSPSSISMVSTYWSGLYNRSRWRSGVPATARGVYDAGARIWGNWPFNTAYASHLGLRSRVSRFNHIQQVERWINAGIPVITSVAWDNRYSDRRLDNASIPRATYGHLLVVVGFTNSGDVIVNDPASSPRSQVRRVYDRGQFSRAWLNSDRWRGGRSDGVVYLVHPRNRSIPGSWASNGSW